MNIFFLDRNVETCAQYHNDKHIVKMILEYAQLLSTAHRIIDGQLVGKRWVLPEPQESTLYKATHANHPSAIWARSGVRQYNWLYDLFTACLDEYTFRYGKVHATDRLRQPLFNAPINMPMTEWTDPTPAMPDEYKVAGNSIQSYQNYYIGSKREMSRWTNREMPLWFEQEIYKQYGQLAEVVEMKDRFVTVPSGVANANLHVA